MLTQHFFNFRLDEMQHSGAKKIREERIKRRFWKMNYYSCL